MHYIEVASESNSDEHEEFHDTKEEEEKEKEKVISKDGTLAALSESQDTITFKFEGY